LALERQPLIVVKRCYYDEFLSGAKPSNTDGTKGPSMRGYFAPAGG